MLLYLLNAYGDSGGVSDSELEEYEKEYNLGPIESDDCVPFSQLIFLESDLIEKKGVCFSLLV